MNRHLNAWFLLILVPALAFAGTYYVDVDGLNSTHTSYQTVTATTSGCPGSCSETDGYYAANSAAVTAQTISGTVSFYAGWNRNISGFLTSATLTLNRTNNAGVVLSEVCHALVDMSSGLSGSQSPTCAATTTNMTTGDRLQLVVDVAADFDTNGNSNVNGVYVIVPVSSGATCVGNCGWLGML